MNKKRAQKVSTLKWKYEIFNKIARRQRLRLLHPGYPALIRTYLTTSPFRSEDEWVISRYPVVTPVSVCKSRTTSTGVAPSQGNKFRGSCFARSHPRARYRGINRASPRSGFRMYKHGLVKSKWSRGYHVCWPGCLFGSSTWPNIVVAWVWRRWKRGIRRSDVNSSRKQRLNALAPAKA